MKFQDRLRSKGKLRWVRERERERERGREREKERERGIVRIPRIQRKATELWVRNRRKNERKWGKKGKKKREKKKRKEKREKAKCEEENHFERYAKVRFISGNRLCWVQVEFRQCFFFQTWQFPEFSSNLELWWKRKKKFPSFYPSYIFLIILFVLEMKKSMKYVEMRKRIKWKNGCL